MKSELVIWLNIFLVLILVSRTLIFAHQISQKNPVVGYIYNVDDNVLILYQLPNADPSLASAPHLDLTPQNDQRDERNPSSRPNLPFHYPSPTRAGVSVGSNPAEQYLPAVAAVLANIQAIHGSRPLWNFLSSSSPPPDTPSGLTPNFIETLPLPIPISAAVEVYIKGTVTSPEASVASAETPPSTDPPKNLTQNTSGAATPTVVIEIPLSPEEYRRQKGISAAPGGMRMQGFMWVVVAGSLGWIGMIGLEP